MKEKTCPRCNKTAKGLNQIRKVFGTVIRDNGNEVARAYCKPCNNEYNKERREAKKGKKRQQKIDSIVDEASKAAELIEEELKSSGVIQNYKPTHILHETIGIVRFDREELIQMLQHLEASKAQEIGIGIRKI